MIDSLNNDSWARSGGLALRELPTELCLFRQGSPLRRGKVCLGTLPFLIRTESNIFLVEIYGIICDLTVTDLKSKGYH